MIKLKLILLSAVMATTGFFSGYMVKGDASKKTSPSIKVEKNIKEDTTSDKNTSSDMGQDSQSMSPEEIAKQDQEMKKYVQGMKEDIDPKVYTELMALFDKLISFDKKGDMENSDKVYQKISDILQKNGINVEVGGEGESVINSYDVENGTVPTLENDANKSNVHKMLWMRVKTLYPKAYLNRLKSFSITSDGFGRTQAATASIDDTNKNFTLMVDIADALGKNGTVNNRESNFTLVHELGHIITLNDTQISQDHVAGTLKIQEGSTKNSSYLNKFYETFWKDLAKEYEEIKSLKEKDPNQAQAKADEFYEKHKERFVNAYAASEPVEDIAESFAEFVYRDKPSGDTPVDKKINFFYQFKELVKIRAELRSNLGLK